MTENLTDKSDLFTAFSRLFQCIFQSEAAIFQIADKHIVRRSKASAQIDLLLDDLRKEVLPTDLHHPSRFFRKGSSIENLFKSQHPDSKTIQLILLSSGPQGRVYAMVASDNFNHVHSCLAAAEESDPHSELSTTISTIISDAAKDFQYLSSKAELDTKFLRASFQKNLTGYFDALPQLIKHCCVFLMEDRFHSEV